MGNVAEFKFYETDFASDNKSNNSKPRSDSETFGIKCIAEQKVSRRDYFLPPILTLS